MDEAIRGLPVYGNSLGERFTLSIDDSEFRKNPFSFIRISITELRNDHGTPYEVFALLVLGIRSAIYIAQIDNNAEAACNRASFAKTGLGFFPIILEEVRKIAMNNGKTRIIIVPENPRLRHYYSTFGFEVYPDCLSCQLVLPLATSD